MLTIIVRRNAESRVIQLTQYNIVKEIWTIPGAELLTEDSWTEGLKKVRTPFVCLVEADCVLSPNYLTSMISTLKTTGVIKENGLHAEKRGGYRKLAMIFPVVGVNSFRNKFYGYKFEGDEIYPSREKMSYQVGFVPGAILRYTSIKDTELDWDEPDLVKLSAEVSSYLWNSNRRLRLNPEATYVSTDKSIENPHLFDLPSKVKDIFFKEAL